MFADKSAASRLNYNINLNLNNRDIFLFFEFLLKVRE